MPTKTQCANPDCLASFVDAQTELAYCPKCGSKITQADEPPSFPTRTFERDTPLPSMNEGIDAKWQFRKETLFADRFTILNRLGFGGMGEVYHARDTKLPRDVAIKVVLPHWLNDENFLKRFRREAHAVALLKHPNICVIYDVGDWEGRPYIVMDFIDGTSLGSYLKRRAERFDPIKAAKLVRMVAVALQTAHEAGIIHRDLKPDNIMISRAGRPIVMDFGLAKAQEAAGEDHLTASGAMMGTAHYMPIEQFRDAGKADPRSDIYSLGVIFYRLLTGQLPYPGRNPQAVFAAILETNAIPPSTVRPGIDPQLDAIVMRAMARESADRFGSMTGFVAAIDGYLKPAEGRSSASPSETPASSPWFSVRTEPETRLKEPLAPPRNRLPIPLAAMGFLALFLGIVVYVATDKGTLRIEGTEPGMVVRIDGEKTVIENVGEPITVRAGSHGLLVQRGDGLATAPETFEIQRGKETILRVQFLPKEVAKAPAPFEEKKSEPPKPPEKPVGPPTAPASVVTMVETKPPARVKKPASKLEGTKAGEVDRMKLGDIEFALSWCPPGTFTMGSPPGEPGRENNENQVEVTLTQGFWMMQTEMTQELYQAVISKNPSHFQGPKMAVETVSYTEAVECAAVLTPKLREAGQLPDGWELRLPTEAQWEYAARAGSKTAFPFGDRLTVAQANFGNTKTCEVANYQANAWGFFDTCGNVWEWTRDGYDAKRLGGSDPFVAGTEASHRMFRGGCLFFGAEVCRSASRSSRAATYRDKDLGFRLAVVQALMTSK